MTECKFDSLIINGKANGKTTNEMVYDAYLESSKQYKELPAKLRKDSDRVRLDLFKETCSQKENGFLFRKTNNANDALISHWISKVKRVAYLYASYNDLVEFSGFTKTDAKDIADNNNDVEYLKNIESELARKGIIFIIEPSISGLKLDGVVFKIESGNPVIAMSLRYNRLDNFWFTLMHELAHIVLHIEKIDSYIIDDLDQESTELIELEANKLAGNLLIPRNVWRSCAVRRDRKLDSILAFSKDNNVHPAIVAGRLRKETDNYEIFSNIINDIDVREVLSSE